MKQPELLVNVAPKTVEDKRLTLRIPSDLYRMIAVTAEMEGVPVNWWVIKTLDRTFYWPGKRPRLPGPKQLERK
jgi:predicted DNA binding CopG/RHH family protein